MKQIAGQEIGNETIIFPINLTELAYSLNEKKYKMV